MTRLPIQAGNDDETKLREIGTEEVKSNPSDKQCSQLKPQHASLYVRWEWGLGRDGLG